MQKTQQRDNYLVTPTKKEYEIIPVTSKTYLEVIDLLKQIKYRQANNIEKEIER